MKHTEGKLVCNRGRGDALALTVTSDGGATAREIAELIPIRGVGTYPETEANAAHLAACWNEFADYPKLKVEGSVKELVGLVSAIIENRGVCFIPETGSNVPVALYDWTERATAVLAKFPKGD